VEPIKIDSGNLEQLFARQKARAHVQRSQSVKERKKLLRSFEEFLLKNQQRINEEIHKDFKKPFAEVELSELYPVLTEIRNALVHLDEWAKPKKIDAPLTFLGTRSEIRYEAKGVCLIISPWNFPLNLCLGPLVSCLAAGNAVILKPSEMTPFASRLIVELVSDFFHDDLVATVEGGADVSTELLKLPFDHIFFTGSPEVGKIVMKAAAENLTSVTLELGGKSPAIIDKTANLQDAARRIGFGKFLNNGQTCIAPDYVLIEESVRREFISELKLKVTELFGENGKIDAQSSSYSRIVNQKHFVRLISLVDDAVKKGSTMEWDGPVDQASRFIHPVLLSAVPETSRIMTEEIFGPVLPIVSFSSVEDVISKVNGRPKPLALYIFSTDRRFREKILSETSAGGVCINDCILQFSHPDLPFGGINYSGLGKAHGHYGFLSFSNEKPIVKQRKGFTATYAIQPPYSRQVKRIIDFIVRWF
jgi:aldehyde dehydrogenase (NAD+)